MYGITYPGSGLWADQGTKLNDAIFFSSSGLDLLFIITSSSNLKYTKKNIFRNKPPKFKHRTEIKSQESNKATYHQGISKYTRCLSTPTYPHI